MRSTHHVLATPPVSRRPGLAGTALAAALLPCAASAAIEAPTSYSDANGALAGQPGYFHHNDAAATKLTGGDPGTTNTVDGTWAGWPQADSGAANIRFNFSSAETVTGVALYFLRSNDANTQLPESVTINGTDADAGVR